MGQDYIYQRTGGRFCLYKHRSSFDGYYPMETLTLCLQFSCDSSDWSVLVRHAQRERLEDNAESPHFPAEDPFSRVYPQKTIKDAGVHFKSRARLSAEGFLNSYPVYAIFHNP
jgi:hypothetical protein